MRQRVQRLTDAGRDADRRGHRPDAARLHPAGHDRHPRRRATRRVVADALAAIAEVDYVVHHRRQLRPAGRGGLRERRRTCSTLLNKRIRDAPGRAVHRDVRLPQAAASSSTTGAHDDTQPERRREPSSDQRTPTGALLQTRRGTTSGCTSRDTRLRGRAASGRRAHHHARGEGHHDLGRPRQRVHRRPRRASSWSRSATAASELAEAAAKQAEELAFFPLWSYAHPRAIELADRLAGYAPGDLNRVFFSTGGGEAVETAWKLAKQYFKLTGKPTKYKVISRAVAYHGTPQGALSITGIPAAQGDVRAARARRAQGAQHQHVPGAGAPAARREGLRPVGRGPHRRGDRVRGPRHGRRRVPRAGAELRRLLPAAAGLLRAGPRDLRRVRRAARLRRGDLLVRADRRRCSRATTSATSRTSSPVRRA